MNRLAAFFLIITAVFCLFTVRAGSQEAAEPPVYTYVVKKIYTHDTEWFTQGLALEGGLIYEGTGLYGRSRLMIRDLVTGEVLKSRELPPSFFGEGIALFGDRLIQLTWKTGQGFVYDKRSLKPLGSFTYPGQGWGLTTDGQALIMSDGTADLRFLDPHDFRELKKITVMDKGAPVSRLNELEYIKGSVWANVWQTDRIAIIDPENGRVTAWVDLSGILPPTYNPGRQAVLNGTAYDPETGRILVTGKLWPMMFEIELKKK